MARALGRDHDYIDIRRGDNGLEMNAEAMRETKNFALAQSGFNRGLIEFGLGFVWS